MYGGGFRWQCAICLLPCCSPGATLPIELLILPSLAQMITIPVKNPIAIYNALMKPLLESYGLWQQVRVDHGTEYTLVLTVQHLAGVRLW